MPQTTSPETASDETLTPADTAPVALKRILVALDASDHANRALEEAVRLAGLAKGAITGIHAYAARLHDRRFRQMEGGLPERYLQEAEMEHQRDVHDDLITRGLNIISDSYHDTAGQVCDAADIPFARLSPEGKNYRQILTALARGDHDVLVLGAVGLGAVPGGSIGSVCERVVRRSPVDVLVIRDLGRAIGDGPIVAAVDGSDKSFGALKTALDLGRRLAVPVHAVAAYDPHYHYVAFNKIAQGLSEEAGQVFRFKEQEQLHEELIDDGIAKIYQSHLDVAHDVAATAGLTITSELVAGKPHRAIQQYLETIKASLVVVGMTGIHADDGLNIGGCAENLLRNAPCQVWLGQVTHVPDADIVAEKTLSWSDEATAFLGKAPSFVQDMARKAVERHALSEGHTFITTDIVTSVMRTMMPGAGGGAQSDPLAWDDDAGRLAKSVGDKALENTIRLRAEKEARRQGAASVSLDHVRPFVGDDGQADDVTWSAAALARLSRVPEMVRETCRQHIEAEARDHGVSEIDLALAEQAIGEVRQQMCPVPEGSETE